MTALANAIFAVGREVRYVATVRYGNYFQLVTDVTDGHVSVALEPSADLSLVHRVLSVIRGPA